MSSFYQPIDQQEILYLIYLLLKIDIDVDSSARRSIFAVYYLSNFSYFINFSSADVTWKGRTEKIDLVELLSNIDAATTLCLVFMD